MFRQVLTGYLHEDSEFVVINKDVFINNFKDCPKIIQSLTMSLIEQLRKIDETVSPSNKSIFMSVCRIIHLL